MSIIRVGSNQKYSDGWESAFGKEPAKKSSSAKKTAKPAKKKSAKAAVKKTAKKKK
ncbi:hypothetical protein [Blastopirellula retiformator]|uniref:Uncharacterized protein n=1 Tax=Blastopirellula retiformator TaxID=2527970 RepID=A0A5C5V1D7_9BACT|nr:hypothetical protein [Blastopirellula retiformator]TWT31552.1 hypothetical protein Enr8_34740 [Blastopirellula retiformator]